MTLLLMLRDVTAHAEAPPTELTGVVSFLQVHQLQVTSSTGLRAENGAAETTDPLAVLHNREAVLDRGRRVHVSDLQKVMSSILVWQLLSCFLMGIQTMHLNGF